MVGVLAAFAALGGVAGAAIGFFAGGVGAIPGAATGAELGMLLLNALDTAVDKLTVSSTSVLTMRSTPQGWRVLLTANIEGLAEQLLSSLGMEEQQVE